MLESVLESGLLLVPECREYAGEVDSETGQRGTPILSFQRRFCLTQLNAADLKQHGDRFGHFHLVFGPRTVRALGGVPVFYIPQPSSDGADGLLLLGNTFIHRLSDIQGVLEDLATLERTLHANDTRRMLHLTGLHGSERRKLRTADVRWILNGLKGQKEDFASLSSALRVISFLFYPTENTTELGRKSVTGERKKASEELWYYMQREWRILGDIVMKDRRVDRALTPKEKKRLINIDSEFFLGPIQFPKGRRRVVDECRMLEELDGVHIREKLEMLIVPQRVRTIGEEKIRSYGLTIEVRSFE